MMKVIEKIVVVFGRTAKQLAIGRELGLLNVSAVLLFFSQIK